MSFNKTKKENKGLKLMVCTNYFDICLQSGTNSKDIKLFDKRVEFCKKQLDKCLINYDADKRK